jgi:homogentisate 1,2-dioxygenase
VLGNADVRQLLRRRGETSPLYRNATGDECVYVEAGSARVETTFGHLEVGQGDYVVLPRATTHRWVPAGDEPLRLYCIEANSHIGPPKRYLSKHGQFLEHAPYCERDLRLPSEPEVVEGAEVEVYLKHRGRGPGGLAGTVHVLPEHPFDVVGWDGCLYPYAFNVSDFEPVTGRVHQPPPVHQVFEAGGFVVCNFVPRKVDYHPLAVPVPYYHSNVDSDEVMFYVGGDYEARKGSGIGQGSISLHPGGHSHGPQPGAVERSLGAEFFDELAVMVDTFRPLELGEGGAAWTTARTPGRGRSPGGDAGARSWLGLSDDDPFGLQTLPYGSFLSRDDRRPRVGVAVGDRVLDLGAAADRLLPKHAALFDDGDLDRLLASGPGSGARCGRR